MWTQHHSISVDGAPRPGWSSAGLAVHVAIIAGFFALVVPAKMATAQALDSSNKAVQPKAVRAAERHQAQVNKNDAALGAAIVQSSRQELRSKPMNRTARAHLKSQPTGLTPVAMVCHDCEGDDTVRR